MGHKRGLTVTLDKQRGKGSHALLTLGARTTTLAKRRGEIGPGLLKAMCRQLGITRDDLQ